MFDRHDELLLLSRMGHVPPPRGHRGEWMAMRTPRRRPHVRDGLRRLARASPVTVTRRPPAARIDLQEYLELEFSVDERR